MSIHEQLVHRILYTVPIGIIQKSLYHFLIVNTKVRRGIINGTFTLITNEHTWCVCESTLSFSEMLSALNNSAKLC